MAKKKIIFLITNSHYIRNYIETGLIKKLNSKFNIIFLINKNLKNKLHRFKTNRVFYYETKNEDKNKNKLNDIIVHRFRNRSKYFRFRLKRIFRYDFRVLNEILIEKKIKRNFFNKIKFFHIIIKNFFLFSAYKFFSTKLIFNLLISKKINNQKANSDLNKILSKSKFELLVMPTSGYSPEVFDIISICKNLNKKSYFIIDNWDNLSTKMIFLKKPDFLGVWGEQTAYHAKKIHKFKQHQIFKIGSSRFDSYFKNRNKNLKNYFNFKYILFLGSSGSWDEEGCLDILDKTISRNAKIFKNVKIVYRFHPFRQRKTILNYNWKNVIIDPKINENFKKKGTWPELNYYSSLLSNCEFCVGGLTSMLIESTIFYKKYLAISYDDGISLLTPKTVIENFEHLKKIEKIPNIYFCKNKNNLENDLKNLYLKKNINKNAIDIKRNYFLYRDKNKNFFQTIESNINNILKQ